MSGSVGFFLPGGNATEGQAFFLQLQDARLFKNPV